MVCITLILAFKVYGYVATLHGVYWSGSESQNQCTMDMRLSLGIEVFILFSLVFSQLIPKPPLFKLGVGLGLS